MYEVLIIDDEPWSREAVKELGNWEELGLKIIGEAEDGNQGLRLLDEMRPEIVVTDMRMPGKEGVELLKNINEEYPQLKIIVMSGYNDFIYLKQAIKSHAVEYLLKPIDPDELNEALKKCVKLINEDKITNRIMNNEMFKSGDTDKLEVFLSLRQNIFWHMLGLNKSGVLNSLENLEKFLQENLKIHCNTNALNKIYIDFILMLEEFIRDNETECYEVLKQIIDEFKSLDNLNSINELTIKLSSFFVDCIDVIESYRKNKNNFDIKDVKLYVDRNYKEAISLENISQYFFVSKEHLSRVFKSYVGENLSDYITRRRMEKAKEIIVEQNLSIKSAAEMTGYIDIAYFYRVFKKHFGITPGELRREK